VQCTSQLRLVAPQARGGARHPRRGRAFSFDHRDGSADDLLEFLHLALILIYFGQVSTPSSLDDV